MFVTGHWCKSGLVIEGLSAGFVPEMKSRDSGKFLAQTERREELLKGKKKKLLEPVESYLVFCFTLSFCIDHIV